MLALVTPPESPPPPAAPAPEAAAPTPAPPPSPEPAPAPRPVASADEVTRLHEDLADKIDALYDARAFLATVEAKTASARAAVERLPGEIAPLLWALAEAVGAPWPAGAEPRVDVGAFFAALAEAARSTAPRGEASGEAPRAEPPRAPEPPAPAARAEGTGDLAAGAGAPAKRKGTRALGRGERDGRKRPYTAVPAGAPTLAGRLLAALATGEPRPADALARELREPTPEVQTALAGLWSAKRVHKDESVRPALWSLAKGAGCDARLPRLGRAARALRPRAVRAPRGRRAPARPLDAAGEGRRVVSAEALDPLEAAVAASELLYEAGVTRLPTARQRLLKRLAPYAAELLAPMAVAGRRCAVWGVGEDEGGAHVVCWPRTSVASTIKRARELRTDVPPPPRGARVLAFVDPPGADRHRRRSATWLTTADLERLYADPPAAKGGAA